MPSVGRQAARCWDSDHTAVLLAVGERGRGRGRGGEGEGRILGRNRNFSVFRLFSIIPTTLKRHRTSNALVCYMIYNSSLYSSWLPYSPSSPSS